MAVPLNTHHPEQFSLLIADDNQTSLLLLQEILMAAGYRVEAAQDGNGTLSSAAAGRHDLILLDVMMPGMDGFEVCRRLKANTATEPIPVIFLTALANTQDIVTGFKAGGADYIIKPFNIPEVLARIQTQLKVVTLNRELQSNHDLQEQIILNRTEELETVRQELKTTRNLLQSVVNAVPGQLFVVDRGFNVLCSNTRFSRTESQEGEKTACPTCFNRFMGVAEPCKQCGILEVFESGQVFEREVASETDGRVWEMRAIPVHDEAGGLPMAIEYVREVSSIKEIERDNARRRRFLESVLQEAAEAIITLDKDHHVIDWNPGAVRMFGYQPEEAKGRHLDSLVAQGASLDEAGAKTRNILIGRVVEPFETVRQHRDGSPIHVIAAGAPIIIDGVLTGAVAVYTDISAIRLSAEELRSSRQLLLTVLESIDAFIYVADLQSYEILFMNQRMQKEFGGDLSGGVCWRDFHGRSGPCACCLSMQTAGDVHSSEGCVSDDYNPETGRWVRNHHRIIRWVDNRMVRLQVATDISDQKRIEHERKDYERRIQQLQKMEAIGTLAGGIAHDFNNILSAVFGYTELAFLQAAGLPVLQRNLSGIIEAARRARDLVQQILLFSRQGEQELKPLQLKPLIKEALKMLRSSLPTTIHIETRLEGIFENVLANPTQIHQILMNLCTNAAQAMEDDGGVLTVHLSQVQLTEEKIRRHPERRPGTYLQLRIQDTGRGIAPEMIDKIYNPYFTTKAKGQGTGLGLAVVHGIVQSYSGIIEVSSEIGHGTVFDIYLPAIHLEAAKEESPAAQLPTGQEHILLVDDEEMLTEVLGNMLSLLGYKVTATQSSIKALEIFRNDPSTFDLLISDMTMPELTGDRLTAEIVNIRPDIPVIICTGYNRRLSDTDPGSLAVQAILMKPVEHLLLATTVRNVLDAGTMDTQKKEVCSGTENKLPCLSGNMIE